MAPRGRLWRDRLGRWHRSMNGMGATATEYGQLIGGGGGRKAKLGELPPDIGPSPFPPIRPIKPPPPPLRRYGCPRRPHRQVGSLGYLGGLGSLGAIYTAPEIGEPNRDEVGCPNILGPQALVLVKTPTNPNGQWMCAEDAPETTGTPQDPYPDEPPPTNIIGEAFDWFKDIGGSVVATVTGTVTGKPPPVKPPRPPKPPMSTGAKVAIAGGIGLLVYAVTKKK